MNFMKVLIRNLYTSSNSHRHLTSRYNVNLMQINQDALRLHVVKYVKKRKFLLLLRLLPTPILFVLNGI